MNLFDKRTDLDPKEVADMPFWKRLHYGGGVDALPRWGQVLFYIGVVLAILLVVRLAFRA